jgi:hypothetical protein
MEDQNDILGLLDPTGALRQRATGQARGNALTALGLGLLRASRGQPGQGRPSTAQAFGEAGPGALQAYQQTFDKTLADALKGIQIQELRKKQQQQEAGRAAMQQAYERMSGLSPQGALAMPGGQAGPTVQRAEMIGQRQPMSQQEVLGLAMNPNIDLESAKRIVDIAQLSAPKAGPGVVGEYQAAIAGGLIPKDTTLQQYISQVKKPLVQNIIGGQQGLENEMKIRAAFAGEPVYKARQEMQSAYGQITDSLRESSPAGDLAAATKFMKLLDPGSVVRESELYLAMQASGALDRMVNYANLRLSGQKLTPDQRKDFQSLADKLYSTATNTYNQKRNEYAGLAEAYGLDINRAVGAAAVLPERTERAQPQAAQSRKIPTVEEMMQSGVTGGIKIRRIGD